MFVFGFRLQTNICDFYRQNICSVTNANIECLIEHYRTHADATTDRFKIENQIWCTKTQRTHLLNEVPQ